MQAGIELILADQVLDEITNRSGIEVHYEEKRMIFCRLVGPSAETLFGRTASYNTLASRLTKLEP